MGNNELYQEWMKYAVADSTAAVHLTNHHPVQLEIVCYHCQQAGEKALKAILAYHDEQIPRTHNLYELLKSCVNYFELCGWICVYDKDTNVGCAHNPVIFDCTITQPTVASS